MKHLCRKCKYEFPTCEGSSDDIVFGIDVNPKAKGRDADKVVKCNVFKKRKYEISDRTMIIVYVITWVVMGCATISNIFEFSKYATLQQRITDLEYWTKMRIRETKTNVEDSAMDLLGK